MTVNRAGDERPAGRLERLRQQTGYYDRRNGRPAPTAVAALEEDDSLPMSMLVAAEVRAWMARRRVTGEMLAEQLGTSGTYVSRRLRGKTSLDVDEIEAIAAVLDVPVSTLLDRALAEADRRLSLATGQRHEQPEETAAARHRRRQAAAELGDDPAAATRGAYGINAT